MTWRPPAAHRAASAALLIAAAAAAPGHGQRAPALGGVELRGGIVFPEHATAALGLAVEGDIGYVRRPQLRLIAGLTRFAANIDREPGDNEGSFVATGFSLGTRYDIVRWGVWAPYIRASVTALYVDADAWDPDVGRLLSGMNAGASLAAGGRYAIAGNGRLSGTFEVRRTLVNNVAHTSVEMGVRALRRGSFAYVEDDAALRVAAPWRDPVEPAPTAPPVPNPAQPAVPVAEPAPAAVAADTAALRAQARAAAAADSARVATAARRQDELAAEAARLAAAVAAERAWAGEALLRRGLERAAAVMTNVAAVRETADAFVVSLGGGAFASGASTLSAAARAELRTLAAVLAGYPGHVMSVEGHTDSQGEAAANQLLSEERAAAVRAALIVEGIDPLWSTARGFGASRPVADNATPAGRALNRRVEVHIARRACTAPPVPGPEGTLSCPGG